MNKYALNRPALITLYGFPGSGKTYFARQLAVSLDAVHLQSDRVRFELFEEPRYDKQEDSIVAHLMQYMSEEFLKVGVSVIYDADVTRSSHRREVREVAHAAKAFPLLVWLQIDIESAFARVVKRDRRKTDDKYAVPLDRSSYESELARMQNPTQVEEYVVISGKHNFLTQQNAVIKKLYDAGLVTAQNAQSNMVKPGLVNLVPNNIAGRVDSTRRNINIH
jgi:predicted kinase